MSKCINCLRGLCNTCMGCDCTHEPEVETNASEPEEETRPSAGGQSRRARSLKRDDALKDQQSTGRKRAARRFPLDREAPCEWRGLKNCGGGINPINGCLDGLQQARHHGPDKSVVNNDEGNVHRICHRCLGPSMRILMADLTWKQSKDVKIGDKIIAFNEDIKNVLKYEYATVTNVGLIEEPSYRFTMASGVKLISSHAHQWVGSSPARHHISWRTSESFKPKYNLRHVVSPWTVDRSWEAGWLAGYLDGEGSLSTNNKNYQLSVGQVEGTVFEHGQVALEQFTDRIHETYRPAHGNRQAAWVLRVTNLPDIMRILGTVRPMRLLDTFNIAGRQPKGKLSAIQAIEFLGNQKVVSIETTSKTMVVEGYLSHNCHNRWHAANNKSYDWNSTTVHPHQPTAMSDVEQWWVAAEDHGKTFKAIHD